MTWASASFISFNKVILWTKSGIGFLYDLSLYILGEHKVIPNYNDDTSDET